MAEPSNTQDDDSTKKETIRITLPPKAEQPSIKRETVRINVPGTTAPAPVGIVPKKETSKIPISSIIQPPAAPAAPKPPIPPPSAPAAVSTPSAPAMPPMPSGVATKPLSGTMPPPPKPGGAPITKPLSSVTPPKPPPLTGKPTIPLKPAPPAGGSGTMPPPPTSGMRPPAPPAPGQSGIASAPVRPASPKKETARINLPSDASKGSAALPKATVKMQQTQPLSKVPAPAISQSMATMSMDSSPAKSDTVSTVLSVLAFLASGAALFFAYQVLEAAKL